MAEDRVQVELLVAGYPNTAEAKRSLNELTAMHKSNDVELLDAGVMARNDEGELWISERAALTPGKGARRGALIGVAFGIVFPPSLIAGAAVGAAAGALTGKASDHGFGDELLREIGAHVQAGHSAIVVMTEIDHAEAVRGVLAGADDIVARTLFADEAGSLTLAE